MSFLIREYPLVVLPSLAVKVGLNEAIVLQQINYWLGNKESGVIVDGKKWIYNTVEQWNEQFPFWSANTLRRAINNLRDGGYLIAEKLNPDPRNNTLYYRVNYDLFNQELHLPTLGNANTQNEQMTNSTDNTTDNTLSIMSGKPDNADAIQVIDYLNSKAGRQFRPTATNIRLVNARLKEGITLEQLHQVIDQKCKDWIGSKFEQYLRPATLFGAEKCNQYVGQIGMQIKDSKPQSQNEKRSNWANEWENVFGNGGNQMPDDYDGLTIDMEQKQ